MKFSNYALCRRSFYILKHGYFTVIAMLAVTYLYFDVMSQEIMNTYIISHHTLLNITREMILISLLSFCLVTGGALFYEFIIKSEE